jgi:serine/threonine protein kinase
VKREISAMKLLNHPNIVKIHEVNIWDSEFHRTSVVSSILRINTELAYNLQSRISKSNLVYHYVYSVAHIYTQQGTYHFNQKQLCFLCTQVIATKTKICLVMEYVPGGQLSDRLVR